MDIKIEVQWTRTEIEKLLERDLNEKGFALYTRPGEKEPYFEWSGAPFEGTQLPLLRVKTQATVSGVLCPASPPIFVHGVDPAIPNNEFSALSTVTTYTGPDGRVQVQRIPATDAVHVPSPQHIGSPTPSKRLLSPEEVEALAALLPDPRYAEAILNSDSEDLFPGASKKRPD